MTTTPKHVAFIMDGNRRWAKAHKLSIFFGHENGAKRIEPLVEYAIEKGITHLTFWAFSTENWQRSQEEVTDLLNVFRKALSDPMIEKLFALKAKICIIGDLTPFPEDIKQQVESIIADSKNHTAITVTIALNYGGRSEILRAVQNLMREETQPLTEETFSKHLYTHGQPDPDYIIRTGGERRLSGYLPWQSVYAELYFTDTLWPDFTREQFMEAIEDFEQRQRRFGK